MSESDSGESSRQAEQTEEQELPLDLHDSNHLTGETENQEDSGSRKRDRSPEYSFEVSRDDSKRFREWTTGDLSVDKKDRERYQPVFRKKSVKLVVPEMDGSVHRRLQERKKSVSSKTNIDHQESVLRSLHFKLLDIVRPILFLWSTLGDGLHLDAASHALKLWAKAFSSTTNARRKNLLKQTNPTYLSMLENSKNFSPAEAELLFGPTFIRNLAEEARSDESFRAANRANPARQAKSSKSQPGPSGWNNSPVNRSFKSNNQSGNSSYRPRDNSGQPSFRYVENSHSIKLGGRLRHFKEAWAVICTDPWILALLQDGFKLEFTEPPRQGSPPRNAPLNPEQSALWNLEIQNLIDKGAIVKASSQTFVSTVFVIPKSSGGWRPIINLKQLNEFLVVVSRWRAWGP